MKITKELKAPEKRVIGDNRLDYSMDIRWFDRRNDTDVMITLQSSSGLTSIVAITKARRIDNGVEYSGTLDAEDLRRLAQICLDGADELVARGAESRPSLLRVSGALTHNESAHKSSVAA